MRSGEEAVFDPGQELLGKYRVERSSRRRGMGALHDVAPEPILGGDVGPQADVYAAGLIFHERVAGQPASSQETDLLPSVQEVSIMHQLAAPARLDACKTGAPKELDDAVERMLAIDPASRPTAHGQAGGASGSRPTARAARIGAVMSERGGTRASASIPRPSAGCYPRGARTTTSSRRGARAPTPAQEE